MWPGTGSTNHPLRLGVIECGYVSETCHLPALAHLRQQIEVTAVADMDEHRRRRVAGIFGIGQTFTDLESMLRDASIDAVAVCTPADSHADTVIIALEAGKHVLVEKPLARTLDDA